MAAIACDSLMCTAYDRSAPVMDTEPAERSYNNNSPRSGNDATALRGAKNPEAALAAEAAGADTLPAIELT
ncbi:MAG: hypothetical protein ABJA62_12170, partial [Luteimonas sp.]